MSQTDKKQVFPKKCFLSRKRSSGYIEYSFDNPADFFGETPKSFVQYLTLTKQKETGKKTFEIRWFSTTCSRSRRLQFWQTKRKLFNKKGHLVSLKVQKSKMLITVQKLFSEDLFPSSKSSYEQVESSTDYPAGKVLSKGKNFVAQSSTLIENALFYPNFFPLNVPVGTWKWSFHYRANFFVTKDLMFVFVKCHKVVRRVVLLSEKIIKMVVWTGRMNFWHNRGNKIDKSP